MPQRSGLLVCVLLALLCGGCAHVVVDDDGTRRVTGWVRLTLPGDPLAGADTLRVESIGLLMTRHAVLGASVALGWSDTSITALRNDALVRRPGPPGPVAATAEPTPHQPPGPLP